MPGFLLDMTSSVGCAHSPGQAKAAAPNARVKVAGNAIPVPSAPYTVTGCALTGTPNPPCATAQWTTAATRVASLGQKVLLADSQASCVPTGTPVTITKTQARVKAL